MLDRLIDDGTVVPGDAQGDIVTSRDTTGEPKHIEDFRALQATGSEWGRHPRIGATGRPFQRGWSGGSS
jgi:hypothetical protein